MHFNRGKTIKGLWSGYRFIFVLIKESASGKCERGLNSVPRGRAKGSSSAGTAPLRLFLDVPSGAWSPPQETAPNPGLGTLGSEAAPRDCSMVSERLLASRAESGSSSGLSYSPCHWLPLRLLRRLSTMRKYSREAGGDNGPEPQPWGQTSQWGCWSLPSCVTSEVTAPL